MQPKIVVTKVGTEDGYSLDITAKAWHTLYLLADYPVLATLARMRTDAQRLDGRACHFIYQQALDRIDWSALAEREQEFMRTLGIEPVEVLGFSLADQQCFAKALLSPPQLSPALQRAMTNSSRLISAVPERERNGCSFERQHEDQCGDGVLKKSLK